jgi:hypothetical protein
LLDFVNIFGKKRSVLATCPKSARVRYNEFKKFKGEILPINLCHVAHDSKICELEKEESSCFLFFVFFLQKVFVLKLK